MPPFLHLSTLFNVEDLLYAYGYAGVFVVVLLESGIIFALPGDSLLFTAGLLASVAHLNMPLLILLIFLGSFLGSILGYLVGYYIEHLHKYALFRRILSQEHLNGAHSFFKQHGFAAILISRFVPVLRTFTPIAAGIAEMELGPFLRYSLLSAVLWALSIPVIGFYLGQEFPWIRDYISYFIIGIVLVSLVPAVLAWQRKRPRRSRTR